MLSKKVISYVAVFLVLTTMLGVVLNFLYSYTNRGLRYHLATYESTGDSENVRDYLLAYHGEAEDHQAAMEFIHRSIENPEKFVQITNHFSKNESEKLIPRFAFAVLDTQGERRFDEMFAEVDSEFIRLIRVDLDKRKKN